MTTATASPTTQISRNAAEQSVLKIFDAGLSELRRNWGWILGAGICLILTGTAAITMPFVSSLAVEVIVGLTLIISGLAATVAAFFTRNWTGFFVRFASGLLNAAIGGLMLLSPLAGLVSLTMLIAVFLGVEGISRIVVAMQTRQQVKRWGWMLASGVITTLCGGIIATQLPVASLVLIGTLVGVNLVLSGWSHVLLGLEARRISSTETI